MDTKFHGAGFEQPGLVPFGKAKRESGFETLPSPGLFTKYINMRQSAQRRFLSLRDNPPYVARNNSFRGEIQRRVARSRASAITAGQIRSPGGTFRPPAARHFSAGWTAVVLHGNYSP